MKTRTKSTKQSSYQSIQNRLRMRKALDKLETDVRMYYDAASRTRIRNDWKTSTDTPYSDICSDLKTIIARSRESSDNNGLSDAIDTTFQSNVVHTGIKPEAVVKKEGVLLDDLNRKLNDGWERYNDQWDRSGYGTYYENQALMIKTIINSGSILVNLVPSKRGSYLPIANQIIEPDRLDFARDSMANVKTMLDDAAPGGQTQFGIRLDEYGEPISFWINGIKAAVPASQMDIRFRKRRPEQFIGVPWKAPVLPALWDMSSFLEDHFVASRIRAMIALWVHKADMPGLLKKANTDKSLTWEPARIMYTEKKPEVVSIGDNEGSTFDPISRLMQRMIAIGTGLSYQVVTKDLQGMNFAASRANILEDRRLFRMWQKWYTKHICQKDWNAFVKWSFASGKLAPYSYTDYSLDPWMFSEAYWQSPGWDWVDPYNDAKASIELHKMNMLSLKDHYGSSGKNWKRELEQIAEERKMMKELKVDYLDLGGAAVAGVKPKKEEQPVVDGEEQER